MNRYIMLLIVVFQINSSAQCQLKSNVKNYSFIEGGYSKVDFFKIFDTIPLYIRCKNHLVYDALDSVNKCNLPDCHIAIDKDTPIIKMYYNNFDTAQMYITILPKKEYDTITLKMLQMYMKKQNEAKDYYEREKILNSYLNTFIYDYKNKLDSFTYIGIYFDTPYLKYVGWMVWDMVDWAMDEYMICDNCSLRYHIFVLEKSGKWKHIGQYKAVNYMDKINKNPKYDNDVEFILKEIPKRIVYGENFDDILKLTND